MIHTSPLRATLLLATVTVFGGILAGASRAQTISSTPLVLSASTLADGQANVPLETTFEFTFDRKMPFNSVNNLAFRFEPRQLLQRKKFFFGGDKSLEFTVVHQPNTDYVMYAFGANTCDPDGSRAQGCGENPQAPQPSRLYLQTRPFVRSYTTAPTAGTLPASGTVSFGDVSAPPAKSGGRAAVLRALIEEAFSDAQEMDAPLLLTSGQAESLEYTVVFLLDRYTFNTTAWRPRAGAAPDASGAFSMAHVRKGQYWPIAVNFADRFGKTIARYGYHDANGDFQPDPVEVGDGGVSDLKIVLLPDEPILAREAMAIARKRSATLFPDAELQAVTALGAGADGRATLWRYGYYNPADGAYVSIDVGSFNTYLFSGDAPPGAATRQPLPEPFVDSDAILQKAESDGGAGFRALFPGEDVVLTVEAGDLGLPVRPAAPRVFWHVMYESPFGALPDTSLSLFYDAATGEKLNGTPVAIETPETKPQLTLGVPTPNPVRGHATLAYSVQQSSRTRLDVFDALGRHVATLVDAYVTAGTHTAPWDATALPNGTYFLRLQTEAQAVQQAAVVLR